MIDAPDVRAEGLQLSPARYWPTTFATRWDDGIVDPIAIARRLNGDDTVTLSSREVIVAVLKGTHLGMSAALLAERLGMVERHVCRIRAHDVKGLPWRRDLEGRAA